MEQRNLKGDHWHDILLVSVMGVLLVCPIGSVYPAAALWLLVLAVLLLCRDVNCCQLLVEWVVDGNLHWQLLEPHWQLVWGTCDGRYLLEDTSVAFAICR